MAEKFDEIDACISCKETINEEYHIKRLLFDMRYVSGLEHWLVKLRHNSQ